MPLVQYKIVYLHLKGGKLPLLIALFELLNYNNEIKWHKKS